MAGLVRGHKGLILPTGFTVASDTATVSIGNPYQIEYTITPANATNQKIKWTSSNTSIATVDDKGIITAVAVGTCTVTGVYSYDGTTVTISVTTTNISVSGVSLNESTLSVPLRGNAWLHATVAPSNASNKNVTWTSSDTSVAIVDGGLVKYVGDGTATITVTTADGNYTDTCTVTCYTPASGVYLDKDEVVVTYWDSPVITATVAPPEAANKNVTWSSSDTNIATVDSSGTVTYVSNGNCVITCTTVDGGHTATCDVISNNNPVTGVVINPDTILIEPGSTGQLTAIVSPNNASNKNVIWTSSDTSVATVDENGLVTNVGIGECTVTATTVDGGYTATCAVTCIIPVTGVTLNQSSGEVTATESLQLTATITPSNATIKTVTWSSSNTSVATVDNTGLVTYAGDGTCTITCTTTQGGLTATCSISATSFVPIDTCFGYTGAAQSILLKPHTYCLEVWGASGGVGSGGGENMRGLGGYSGGCLKITSDTTLYIYVGECGAQDQVWKFNGGAPGQERGGGQCASGGGGTDISLCGGAWDSTNHWYSRIIVAGGGGATGEYPTSQCGGHGGGCSGTVGGSNHVAGGPGTQTSAGGNYYNCSNYRVVCAASFGKGGTAYDTCHSGYDANGGGGGWYGGGGGGDDGGGGGGSGYVFTSDTVGNYPSGRIPTSNHYLTNAYSCVGNTSFPSPSGGTETGHSGYGCARIRSL